MFWFIVGILFLIVALLIFGFAGNVPIEKTRQVQGRYGLTDEKYTEHRSFRKVAILPLLIALFFIGISCITIVGTRNVGVVTTFNKPNNRELGAGLHLKAPWNAVHDIDGTKHLQEYTTDNPLKVKIGDLGEAKVALSYLWRIKTTGASQVYQDFNKSDDDIETAVRKALVSTNVKGSLNEELGTYNPMAEIVITSDTTPAEIAKIKIPPIPYEQLNDSVTENFKEKISDAGDLIEVFSLKITYLELPKGTQDKINQFNAKIQESRNTLVDIATKTAKAKANNELAKSVDDSPNVLVSDCIDGLRSGDITNEPGFSCWPGGGSGVVVSSGR